MNEEAEKKCGRPLGIRYRVEDGQGVLYVLDTVFGLFKYCLPWHDFLFAEGPSIQQTLLFWTGSIWSPALRHFSSHPPSQCIFRSPVPIKLAQRRQSS